MTERQPQYQGPLQDDLPHGQGRYWFANGDFYEGDFVRGAIHGQGLYYFASGARYRGGFQDGHMAGEGQLELPDGRVYEGIFQAGRLHGPGRILDPKGLLYEGELHDGLPHGRGRMATEEGEPREGFFERGYRVDPVELRLADDLTTLFLARREELAAMLAGQRRSLAALHEVDLPPVRIRDAADLPAGAVAGLLFGQEMERIHIPAADELATHLSTFFARLVAVHRETLRQRLHPATTP